MSFLLERRVLLVFSVFSLLVCPSIAFQKSMACSAISPPKDGPLAIHNSWISEKLDIEAYLRDLLDQVVEDEEGHLPSIIDKEAVFEYLKNTGAISENCKFGEEGEEEEESCKFEEDGGILPRVVLENPQHGMLIDYGQPSSSSSSSPCYFVEVAGLAVYNTSFGFMRGWLNEKTQLFSKSLNEFDIAMDMTAHQLWNAVHSIDIVIYDWFGRPIGHTRSLFVPFVREAGYFSHDIHYYHSVAIHDSHRKLGRRAYNSTGAKDLPRGEAATIWPLPDPSRFKVAEGFNISSYTKKRPFIIYWPVDHDRIQYDGIGVGADSDSPCVILHRLEDLALADALVWVCGSKPTDVPKYKDQIWVNYCLESIKYHGLWNLDPSYLGQFDMFATYMLSSDLPMTMVIRNTTTLRLEANEAGWGQAESKSRLCLFLAASCGYHFRNDYVGALMEYMEVHSCSHCLNNQPNRCGRDSMEETHGSKSITLISKYKFYLAFENSLADDFVTERFFQALLAGTVPVYYGAKNIDEFAPADHSYINTRDFRNPKELADYLLYLDSNNTAYNEYQTWRQGPLRERFEELGRMSEKSRTGHYSHIQGFHVVRDAERICRGVKRKWEERVATGNGTNRPELSGVSEVEAENSIDEKQQLEDIVVNAVSHDESISSSKLEEEMETFAQSLASSNSKAGDEQEKDKSTDFAAKSPSYAPISDDVPFWWRQSPRNDSKILEVRDALWYPMNENFSSLVDQEALREYMKNIGVVDAEGNCREDSSPDCWRSPLLPHIEIQNPIPGEWYEIGSGDVLPIDATVDFDTKMGFVRGILDENAVFVSLPVTLIEIRLLLQETQPWDGIHSIDIVLYDWHGRVLAFQRVVFLISRTFFSGRAWKMFYIHINALHDAHRLFEYEDTNAPKGLPRGEAATIWPLPDPSRFKVAEGFNIASYTKKRPFIIYWPVDHDRIQYDGIGVGADSDSPCVILHRLEDLAVADALVWVCGSKPTDIPKYKDQIWVNYCLESIKYHGLWNLDPSYLGQFDMFATYMLSSDLPMTMVIRNTTTLRLEANEAGWGQAESKSRLCLFLAASCGYHFRNDYVGALMEYMEVHSCSHCLNNQPNRCGRDSMEETHGSKSITLISKYKFYLAFENSLADDFVTERFFQALLAGTVPVYYGAKNIDEFAPADHSYINTRDFRNPKELADYLLYLDGNNTAYNEYQTWRQGPLRERFEELGRMSEKSRTGHYSHIQGFHVVRDADRICRGVKRKWEERVATGNGTNGPELSGASEVEAENSIDEQQQLEDIVVNAVSHDESISSSRLEEEMETFAQTFASSNNEDSDKQEKDKSTDFAAKTPSYAPVSDDVPFWWRQSPRNDSKILEVRDALWYPMNENFTSLVDEEALREYMQKIGVVDAEGNCPQDSSPDCWRNSPLLPHIEIQNPIPGEWYKIGSGDVLPIDATVDFDTKMGFVRGILDENAVFVSLPVTLIEIRLLLQETQPWDGIHSIDIVLYDWHGRVLAFERVVFLISRTFFSGRAWKMFYIHINALHDAHRLFEYEDTKAPKGLPRGEAATIWPLPDPSRFKVAEGFNIASYTKKRPFIIYWPVDHDRIQYDGIGVGADSDSPCLILHRLEDLAVADALVWVCGSKPTDVPKYKDQIWVNYCLESIKYHGLWNLDPSYLGQFDMFATYMLSSDLPMTMVIRNTTTLRLEANEAGWGQAESKSRLCLFLAASCGYHFRNDYVGALMEYMEVHSCSHCLNNQPNRCGRDSMEETHGSKSITLISKYKFYLAFENSLADDFVTERFFQALLAGTVPVYYGAKNIDEFAPADHSYINTRDFRNPKELADYLLYLDGNNTAYNEYQTWRQGPLRERFEELGRMSEKSRTGHYSHIQGFHVVRDAERICRGVKRKWEERVAAGN